MSQTPDGELLALFIEEAGEALQIAGKILRHGYDSSSPKDPASTPNRVLLAVEVGHVLAAVNLMTHCGDLLPDAVNEAVYSKYESVQQYLHQPDNITAVQQLARKYPASPLPLRSERLPTRAEPLPTRGEPLPVRAMLLSGCCKAPLVNIDDDDVCSKCHHPCAHAALAAPEKSTTDPNP